MHSIGLSFSLKNLLKQQPNAELTWRDGRPVSSRFEDVYFAQDGPDETHRVFLEPAQVLERISNSKQFTIVELGFGTGLNFLVLQQAVARLNTDCRVRYVSIEMFPLQSKEIRESLSPFLSDLQILSDLIQQLPPRIQGWHKRYFLKGQIELSLFYGEVATGMEELTEFDRGGVDAWFLDGFSPDRNPAMWQQELFHKMSLLTRRHGTVTSFSVSGAVKQGLRASGFVVRRVKATSGAKRQSLLANFEGLPFTPTSVPELVRVIGGGLAGVTVAHTLARKGVKVEIFEKSDSLCTETSAIPFAIQHPRLSAAATTQALFRIHSYAHSQAFALNREGVTATGALQLVDDGMSIDRLSDLGNLLGDSWCSMLDAKSASGFSRGWLSQTASLYPRSAVLDVPHLCKSLVSHSNIQVHVNSPQPTTIDVEVPTVLATGVSLPAEIGKLPLEIARLEGQVDMFSVRNSSSLPNHIVIQNGYIAPSSTGLAVGSTYEYEPWGKGLATQANVDRAKAIYGKIELKSKKVFRSRRVITTDRFPIIGRIAKNLWVSWAHGSSGTVTTPYAAEVLASDILGEISLASESARRHTSPDRFLQRQARRPNPFSSVRSRT